MANLQIKGIDEGFYQQIKELASLENRSVSQQVLYLVKEYLTKEKTIKSTKTPAQTLLELSGSWNDIRSEGEIVEEIKRGRKNSTKLTKGL
ncbi:MAG: hypothetical protein HQK84_03080 [Nitrospinae bacterium]|nr:hypothetical protein [Nitrospinota bacterium]